MYEMKMIEYLKRDGNSKIQESFAEYSFLRDLIADGIRNLKTIHISRSDFDAFGFDVLIQIEDSEIPIQVQLKAFNGKANYWDIHKSILMNPSGRVVVVRVIDVENDLECEYFLVNSDRIGDIVTRAPKKPNSKKCKLAKADLVKIDKRELFAKLLIG